MDTLKNIDFNVAKMGKEFSEKFKSLESKVEHLEDNQNRINNNLEILNRKLEAILVILEKKTP